MPASLGLGPARSEDLNPARPGVEKRGRSRGCTRARGDQIVDHDHGTAARAGPERPDEVTAPLGCTEPGLIGPVRYGLQHGNYRKAETGADPAREHLGVIEAAFPDPRSPAGDPRDCVPQQAETHYLVAHAGDEGRRGVAARPQLEVEYQGARRVLIRERGKRARGPPDGGLLAWSSQAAQTPTAHGRAALPTPTAA